VDHALTMLCGPGARFEGVLLWVYLENVGETDISKMGYYFGTFGSGIKSPGLNWMGSLLMWASL
jgi:hypothetical protein